MKIRWFLLSIILLTLSINFISAEEFGYNLLSPGVDLTPPVNKSKFNVNASEYWSTTIGMLNNANDTQFNSGGDSETLNIQESWLTGFGNALWCALTGCTMTGDLDMGTNNIDNIANITVQEKICLDATCEHFITSNEGNEFQGVSTNATWIRFRGDTFAGHISYLNTANDRTLDWLQVGANNSYSGRGNSQGVIPNFWGEENFTEAGIINMTKLSNYLIICDTFSSQFFTNGDVCRFTADTASRGMPLLFTGDLEVWRQSVLHQGITSIGDAEYIMNGFDFDIFNGSLHLRTPRTEEVGFGAGEEVPTLTADFEGILNPFVVVTGGGALDWMVVSDVSCHDDECSQATGGTGSPIRTMVANFSTTNQNSLNISFFITSSMGGSDALDVTINNNVGSGEVSLFSITTSQSDTHQEADIPTSMDNRAVITLTFNFSGNNPISDIVFVDTVRVIGNATSSTLVNVTRLDTEFLLGDGTNRMFWNDTTKVLELPGNVSFTQVTESFLNITDAIELNGTTISDWVGVLDSPNFPSFLLANGSTQLTDDWNFGSFNISGGSGFFIEVNATLINTDKIVLGNTEIIDGTIITTSGGFVWSISNQEMDFGFADIVGVNSLIVDDILIDGSTILADTGTLNLIASGGIISMGSSIVTTTGDMNADDFEYTGFVRDSGNRLNLLTGGTDGFFNIVNTTGFKVIQFGGMALNLAQGYDIIGRPIAVTRGNSFVGETYRLSSVTGNFRTLGNITSNGTLIRINQAADDGLNFGTGTPIAGIITYGFDDQKANFISMSMDNGNHGTISTTASALFLAPGKTRTIEITTSGMAIEFNKFFRFGTSSSDNVQFKYSTVADAMMLGVQDDVAGSVQDRSFIIADVNDIDFNFAHGDQSNPTLFIQSKNQVTNEWMSLTYNTTDAFFGVSKGNLYLNSSVVVAQNITFRNNERISNDVDEVLRFEGTSSGHITAFEIVSDAHTFGSTIRGTTSRDGINRLYIDGSLNFDTGQRMNFGTGIRTALRNIGSSFEFFEIAVDVNKSDSSGNVVISNIGSRVSDFPKVLHPTLRIQASGTTLAEGLLLYHNGSNAFIESATGSIILNASDGSDIEVVGNSTYTSPDGTRFTCGVNNLGDFSCT